MFCTGHTMTFIPFASVIARIASRPDTDAGGGAAAAESEPSVRNSEAIGLFMRVSVAGESRQWCRPACLQAREGPVYVNLIKGLCRERGREPSFGVLTTGHKK